MALHGTYEQQFQLFRQSYPELTTIPEGQTPDQAHLEQQIFLMWLVDKLNDIGATIPSSGWRCSTDAAKSNLATLAFNIQNRLNSLQGAPSLPY
jgi:hypothetical protein